MKREKIIVLCLAVIAIVAILFTTVALATNSATAHDGSWAGKGMGDYKGRIMQAGPSTKEVYVTIAVDGMSGDTAPFSIMDMAAPGKEDMAVLIRPNATLAGMYNTSADMGYISTANLMPMTITVDTAARTAIPVAGASAVMGIGDMRVLTREKGYHVSEYGNVSFYLSDGSTKAYTLDKPVRCIYSKDRNLVVIDGNPSYTKALSDALGAGQKFPADAAPVPLASVVSAKKAATAVPVAYTKQAYGAPPT
ncbi:MAG TPA: hypothetical protein VLT35_05730 [Methanocella sp.]|nr:hypothetical protein [Methanocella sp.]